MSQYHTVVIHVSVCLQAGHTVQYNTVPFSTTKQTQVRRSNARVCLFWCKPTWCSLYKWYFTQAVTCLLFLLYCLFAERYETSSFRRRWLPYTVFMIASFLAKHRSKVGDTLLCFSLLIISHLSWTLQWTHSAALLGHNNRLLYSQTLLSGLLMILLISNKTKTNIQFMPDAFGVCRPNTWQTQRAT